MALQPLQSLPISPLLISMPSKHLSMKIVLLVFWALRRTTRALTRTRTRLRLIREYIFGTRDGRRYDAVCSMPSTSLMMLTAVGIGFYIVASMHGFCNRQTTPTTTDWPATNAAIDSARHVQATEPDTLPTPSPPSQKAENSD